MTKQITQKGFGAIAAIVVLVILAVFAGAIVKFGTAQQLGSAQDIESARAWQAAKAGTDWGLFQIFQPGGIWRTAAGCNSAAQTLNLTAVNGFRVTVRCAATPNYVEGEDANGAPQTVRGYRIEAVACNSAICPDDNVATTAGYVERARQVIAFCPVGTLATDCPP
ncbi:MSHA biogenesis protein MshP [Noviherbaspirillum saxi]|uniref:MSHA biogenesis protein MshP n=1 Tax=Noviherbaspirillum saxi TaxID=2320863 RepID=A0A3A3FST8_9BURK|nr:MSHA biogenesis protein MshP [Noviherbaspirillum saxi]RJF98843.1 MSHA biogenesis protein MshP [Noviherbaspirillum saxi]